MIPNAQQIQRELPEFVSHDDKRRYRDAARTLLERPEKLSLREIDYLIWVRDWEGAMTKQMAAKFEKIAEKVQNG